MPKGKPCSAELKARVALEAPQGAKAVGETAPEHGLNPSLARNRKAEAEPAARGAPSVPDSDKGPVFSSAAREGPLASGRARRSTDGEARRAGSAIAERRPRSLETECARISEHGAPAGLRGLIAAYAEQHDDARPRRSLGHGTPAERYYPGLMAA